MTSTPLLSIRGLSVTLGQPLVHGVSFDVLAGQCVALVGESGSGKTLTAGAVLRLLDDGLTSPYAGEVFWEGQNLLTLPLKTLRGIRGGDIGFVFQEARPAPHFIPLSPSIIRGPTPAGRHCHGFAESSAAADCR